MKIDIETKSPRARQRARRLANFDLQANDQIFVRKNPNYQEPIHVVVDGEVMYPGTYSLVSKGDRISDIIERCGGLTDNAFLEGVKLYRRIKVMSKEEENVISEEFKEVILSDTAPVSYTHLTLPTKRIV